MYIESLNAPAASCMAGMNRTAGAERALRAELALALTVKGEPGQSSTLEKQNLFHSELEHMLGAAAPSPAAAPPPISDARGAPVVERKKQTVETCELCHCDILPSVCDVSALISSSTHQFVSNCTPQTRSLS